VDETDSWENEEMRRLGETPAPGAGGEAGR
jgi:hypothetical protein